MLRSIIPIVNDDTFVLEISISQQCNFDCKYCTSHIVGAKATPLDFDKILSFKRKGDYQIYIYGGEPLIHPQIYELLDRLGNERKIRIQTNNSVGKKVYDKIISKHPNVVFALSYHQEYAKFGKFLRNAKFLNDVDRLAEISVMWFSKQDVEISRVYNIMKSMFDNRVVMTPLLPGSKYSIIEWIQKTEIHAFLAKYSPYITGFHHELLINGVKKTAIEAYADNDDLHIYGMRCMIKDRRITYDGHANEWRTCASDVIYGETTGEVCHRHFGCAGDLGYEKHFDSHVITINRRI